MGKMIFCYQKCSSDREKFVAESRKFAKILRSLEQFIQTLKVEQFLVTECFLTSSWRFLRSNRLQQLEFKLEKIIGI
jgi:hypothetical protein